MKRKGISIIISLLFLLSFTLNVFGAVRTESTVNREKECIWIAGNQDFYPIEYYDSKTGTYRGVLPDVFSLLSERTGLNFTYIHNNKFSQKELAYNGFVDIVSCYIVNSDESYVTDSTTVFSYLVKNKEIKIGLAFTEQMDEETLECLKREIERISPEEINGFIMSYHETDQNAKFDVRLLLILMALLLIGLLFWSICLIRKEKKKYESLKMTDLETGIGNLAGFEYCFNYTISEYLRQLYYVGYLIIDNDYLRLYFGENNISDAIKYVANVFSQFEREKLYAYRISENGFAIVFQNADKESSEKRIERLLEKLNRFIDSEHRNSQPFFRMVVYNLNKEDKSAESVLYNLRKNCSQLLGTEKTVLYCDAKMMNVAAEEKKITEQISKAFLKKEFKLYLQFIIEKETKQIKSCEALSRWVPDGENVILPGSYLSKIESFGEISRFDYYMFEQVCCQLHKWNQTAFSDLSISCNFTRFTLSDEQFYANIKEISQRYVFDKSKLIIEITEDMIERNANNVKENMNKCKLLGFRIALDDLGSGYTSLVNLCEYPIDIVKIDRDILLRSTKKRGKELFEGIVALAHKLNLKVVCEGVETAEQNEFVCSANCDYIQGFYYSKPIPCEEGEVFIREYYEKNK